MRAQSIERELEDAGVRLAHADFVGEDEDAEKVEDALISEKRPQACARAEAGVGDEADDRGPVGRLRTLALCFTFDRGVRRISLKHFYRLCDSFAALLDVV